MAKNDYYVIIYQILSYLYQRLKKGEDVDPRQISVESDFFHINPRYWNYIIVNLYRQELIEGIVLINLDGGETRVSRLECCQITPKGIEYLTENSTIKKAEKFFKEAKDFLIPFV